MTNYEFMEVSQVPASFPISEERRQKAEACKLKADRKRSLAASYLITRIYEDAVSAKGAGSADPARMKLACTTDGKPYFRDHPQICFNVSHGGDYAFGAYSDRDIGVDIEKADRKIPVLSDHAYTGADLRHIEDSEDPLMPLKIWVIRESIVKAMGLGIRAMTEFELMWLSEDSGITWGGAYSFHLMEDAPEGYVACVSERTGN